MKNSGFTLIEILIAIAIMAILITFLVPNFLGIRIRARDARRKSDLSQMQKALELYKLDQNPQSYPPTGFYDASWCNQCWAQNYPDCSGNIYLRKFPCDPADPNSSPYIYYLNESDNLVYTLSACLENNQDTDRDAGAITECNDIGRESYTLTEP